MAQMKVGSTGMFVGRTTTDCRFENKVGSEMLHIAYRKPEWQWDTQVEIAEKSMVKGECRTRVGRNHITVTAMNYLYISLSKACTPQ